MRTFSSRRPSRRSQFSLLLLACLTAASCRPAAKSGGVFPAGPITILVGQSPGGGYDLTARLIAVHMSRHLPGQVPVVVENLVGAGGLSAANHLAHQAPADGQTLGYFGEVVVLAQLMGEPGARFDVRQFPIIGSSLGDDGDVCVMSVRSGFDLRAWKSATLPPRIGMTAYGSPSQARAVLLSAALDLPIRPVVGYQGTAQIRLAMESGEVDGACVSSSSYEQNPFSPDRFRVVLRSGESDAPSLAGVPTAESAAETPAAREGLELLAAVRTVSRFFVVRAGTPPERVAVLRAALDATLQDPVFLAAASTARVMIRPRLHTDVETRIRTLLDLPPDRRQQLTSLLTARGDR